MVRISVPIALGLLSGILLPAAASAQAHAGEAVHKTLVEACDAYVEDGCGSKSDPHTLMYLHMREGINHSPLLSLAVLLAEFDHAEAVAAAERIESREYRAFALICVGDVEAKRKRTGDAEGSIAKATGIMKDKEFDSEAAKHLWPRVAGVLLGVHDDLVKAKAACEKIGCPWDSLEEEERQFQLARFRLDRGEVDQALDALHELPADTFVRRKGTESLQNDNGAGLYFWASQPASAYTAEDLLYDWLGTTPSPETFAKLMPHLADDDVRKVDGYLCLARTYKKSGDGEKSGAAIARAQALRDAWKDGEVRDAMECDLLIARLQMEGKTAAKAIVESGLLEKYKGKPWIGVLVRPLLEAGELKIAAPLIEGKALDDHTRCLLAIALAKAGKIDEALARAKEVKGLLDDAIALMGVAMQIHENGDDTKARRIWLEAVDKAAKVPATNSWFPSEGQVSLQRKWQAMTQLLGRGIQMGFVEEALQRFDGENASYRALAMAMAQNGKADRAREWVKSFSEKARAEGSRAFALQGLAEGLAESRR